VTEFASTALRDTICPSIRPLSTNLPFVMLNGAGSAKPLYPSTNDSDPRTSGPRYTAAATNSCPPSHILEKHFSSPNEESHPRFNAVRITSPLIPSLYLLVWFILSFMIAPSTVPLRLPKFSLNSSQDSSCLTLFLLF